MVTFDHDEKVGVAFEIWGVDAEVAELEPPALVAVTVKRKY